MIKKFLFVSIVFSILVSCSPTNNKESLLVFSSKSIEVIISDSNEKKYQSTAYSIVKSLEPLLGTYSQSQLRLVELYYRSFIGAYITYGRKTQIDSSFYENTGDFLLSPINIMQFESTTNKYIVFLREKAIFDEDMETYRPIVRVFREETNKITQINTSDEFCSGQSCNRDWSLFNNLYSGIIDARFRPNAATFYVNEILLSNARFNYNHTFFKTLRLLARYFQYESFVDRFDNETIGFSRWNLGVSYSQDLTKIKFMRRNERYCYPSLNNCQEIRTKNNDQIEIDLNTKEIKFYSNYRWSSTTNPMVYKLNNSTKAIDFEKITNDLLKQFNYSLFHEYLHKTISDNNLNQTDIYKILLFYSL